ncbi:hypothetical protein [Rubellimicrobium sp. CFH 75288]|uniref:DUF7002 family protein n=1 Tax=Rubellimicrobium sp. CFH 75288 TaxID=2697034 RepID=UPI0014126B81|nr:hypothetical protein [Rubellimicrobium sp. CFH 75288]NAZ36084.1 hypothetical protein [Rubellimicrobium sp. CFH 75288]
MTPEALAALHPRLFHLTAPEALQGIARHGLLPPLALLELFEADEALRARTLARRAAPVVLTHPRHGTATVMDNAPLSDAKLARVLDDGLSPADWRRMLAGRVFFWPRPEDLARLLGARLNRTRPRAALVFDTLSLARAHRDRLEISPINAGATLRAPARRGLATFAPLSGTDWSAWRRRRGLSAPDRIREVTVRGPVPDAMRHVLHVLPDARRLFVTPPCQGRGP